ncbi:MAG: Gfo/Idh/MocA family oxidoreductase [Flavobacteriales bacterium]|nr:Gfo/Idh/MocA family oxidoreductase [Flavobacteriales bacterium]
MLKIGVIGAGHLGKIHLRILQSANFVELIGFFDQSEEVRNKVKEEMDIIPFASVESLIEACDIIDIVTPTITHFDCAAAAVRSFKHVFIEKPITNTLEEAKALISLSEEANVQVQIGHVERFNPAFMASVKHLQNPMFIETHRLAQFNPRGTDVSVVLDLMIHDLDIVLSVVDSEIKSISASGVSVLSDTPDIANARIEFDNGCVANLTASRISMKNMRKSRFFQQDAYVSVDFLEKKNEVIQMHDVTKEDPFAVTIDLGEKGKKQIDILSEDIEPNNAIEDELRSFVFAIENEITPSVSIYAGYKALKAAHEIMKKL